jgi:hypothetical protein
MDSKTPAPAELLPPPIATTGIDGEPPVSRIRSRASRRSVEVSDETSAESITAVEAMDVGEVLVGTTTVVDLVDETPEGNADVAKTSLLEVGSEAVVESPEQLLAKLATSTLVESARKIGFKAAFGGLLQGSEDNKLTPRALASHRYRADNHEGKRIPGRNGFSKAWETGSEVADLIAERPFDRHKFYLSLDLSTPEKNERAQAFIEEVYLKAAEQKLSMLTKKQDHDYDSCDLYTWEPEEFAGILAELYPSYPDIWLTTEHPLQGTVDTIDPKHIGFVQEPIGGFGNGSHSARMIELGKFIDEHSGSMDPDTWKQACEEAGVRPDAPWLIDPRRREEYLASKTRS